MTRDPGAQGPRDHGGPNGPEPLEREAALYRVLARSIADHAVFLLDAEGRVRTWTPGAEQLEGYTTDEIVGRHFRVFYPADARDAGDPEAELATAARTGRFEGEGWRVRKDGSRFWARVVITALHEGGELVGFGKVTTDRTVEYEGRKRLARRERQLEEAQEVARLGSWEYDVESDSVRWSSQLYRIFGLDPSAPLSYDRYLQLLLPEDRSVVRAKVDRVLATGEPYSHEHRIVRPDGSIRWVHSRGELVSEGTGGARLVGTTLDITELKHAEAQARELSREQTARAEAERTAQRMSFLAEASAVLDALLEYQETLRTVAWIAVPSFADWCAVDMLDPTGRLERLAVAHMDPDQVEQAEDLGARAAAKRGYERAFEYVARTGEPLLVRSIEEALERAGPVSQADLDAIRQLRLRSVIIVPIQVHGRVLGTLSFASAESGRSYTRDDLLVGQELGSRAGLAIENVQLHAAEQEARARAERARERTSRLQAITAGLSGAVRPEAVAETVIDQGVAAIEADSGSLFLVRPDRRVELVRSRGLADDAIQRYASFSIDDPIPAADAVRTGQPVLIESLDARRYRYPGLDEVQPLTGTRATAAVPLHSGGGVVGVLAFGYHTDRVFTPEDREFLEALAQQCAQALERAWLYETEHLARAAAEEASRAKSRFVATMSHELRTPLSAIIGYQELLMEEIAGPLTDGQRTQLGRIRTAANHLRDLIDQVLTVSRMEAGREELNLGRVDLVELTSDTATLLQRDAEQKGIGLQLELPEGPVILETDSGKVRQILLNLLSNAVKFTAAGEIVVTLEAGAEGAEVLVRDTGTGVAPQDRERIFELFTQADSSPTRQVGGSGLGLAVSRRLAHLLGGQLLLEDVQGDGAAFRLSLPPRAPSAPPSRST